MVRSGVRALQLGPDGFQWVRPDTHMKFLLTKHEDGIATVEYTWGSGSPGRVFELATESPHYLVPVRNEEREFLHRDLRRVLPIVLKRRRGRPFASGLTPNRTVRGVLRYVRSGMPVMEAIDALSYDLDVSDGTVRRIYYSPQAVRLRGAYLADPDALRSLPEWPEGQTYYRLALPSQSVPGLSGPLPRGNDRP